MILSIVPGFYCSVFVQNIRHYLFLSSLFQFTTQQLAPTNPTSSSFSRLVHTELISLAEVKQECRHFLRPHLTCQEAPALPPLQVVHHTKVWYKTLATGDDEATWTQLKVDHFVRLQWWVKMVNCLLLPELLRNGLYTAINAWSSHWPCPINWRITDEHQFNSVQL